MTKIDLIIRVSWTNYEKSFQPNHFILKSHHRWRIHPREHRIAWRNTQSISSSKWWILNSSRYLIKMLTWGEQGNCTVKWKTKLTRFEGLKPASALTDVQPPRQRAPMPQHRLTRRPTHRMYLSQNVALEHTARTTANGRPQRLRWQDMTPPHQQGGVVCDRPVKKGHGKTWDCGYIQTWNKAAFASHPTHRSRSDRFVI